VRLDEAANGRCELRFLRLDVGPSRHAASLPSSPAMPALTELVAPAPGGRVFASAVRAGLGDAAPSGRVRLDALARWLQDVAYDDVVDAGVAERATWVVRRLRMSVEGFPRFGERLELRTFCSGLGRMWAERRTTVEGERGRVEAVALWVHLDPQTQRPRPFDDDEMAVYATSAAGRRVKARLRHPLPGADAARESWWFRAADLDVADHVNNAAYWAPLEERLAAGPEPECFDGEIEFRGGAQAGEAVLLSEDGRLWIASPGDEIHASIVTVT
jgi:acyl-ACP thioesterase